MSEKIKVLVADDEPAIRSLFEAVLGERDDCEWKLASDGEEAYTKIAAYQPDVLITDLKMPRLSGDELTARALELQPSLTILIETGNPSLDGAVQLMRHGVVDILTKPFVIDDLQERLDQAFEKSRMRRKERSVDAIVSSLMACLEAKDPYLKDHSRRVSILAGSVGVDIGVSGAPLEQLEWAALVHDVGKVGVRESILHKPGRLTEEEFAEMKRHPVYSAEIIRPLAHLYGGDDTVRAVYHHHERIDGRGYPAGVRGDEIPLFSRVIAVCDTYDAMSSDRPYRGPVDEKKILEVIADVAGTQLDAGLVDVFLKNVERYKEKISDHRNHA